MQEGRPNWNQKLELIAQAAARNPEAIGYNRSEIKEPDKPIQYGSPEYFQIIATVVNASAYKRPNFVQKAIGEVVGGTVKSIFRKGYEATSRNDTAGVIDKQYLFFKEKGASTLPVTVGKLAESQEDRLIKANLESVVRRLEEGDLVLELKFLLDATQGAFNLLSLYPYYAKKLLWELTKRGLPQLRGSKPEDLTHELLETIDTYFLQDYVNIDGFFGGASEAGLFGESYFRRNVAYLAGPTPDSVSSTPYLVRLKAWKQNQSAYERQKIVVAQALSELKSHSIKERGIFTKEITETLDKNWVMGNLDEVDRIISGILDHPLTKRISDEEPTRRYSLLSSSYDESLPSLYSLTQAIKTAHQYAKKTLLNLVRMY